MGVRARFYLSSITETTTGHQVILKPVCRGEHNKEWSKFTPAGELTMTLTNEAGGAAAFFQRLMKDARADVRLPEVYLDITEAPVVD